MAFIKWILAIPLIVGTVLFALAHPTLVSITWNPFKPPIELPLYFVSLCFLGIGFVLGAFITWLGMARIRYERRQQRKKIKKLEKDIHAANEKMMAALSHDDKNKAGMTSPLYNDNDDDHNF